MLHATVLKCQHKTGSIKKSKKDIINKTNIVNLEFKQFLTNYTCLYYIVNTIFIYLYLILCFRKRNATNTQEISVENLKNTETNGICI